MLCRRRSIRHLPLDCSSPRLGFLERSRHTSSICSLSVLRRRPSPVTSRSTIVPQCVDSASPGDDLRGCVSRHWIAIVAKLRQCLRVAGDGWDCLSMIDGCSRVHQLGISAAAKSELRRSLDVAWRGSGARCGSAAPGECFSHHVVADCDPVP
uniref:Uncharacterized protein n=1 Tax=Triticum urartu TaxID=4572 RepID=A0A8R7PUE8_TRIUA